MNSPLARMILIVLGWYLVIALFLIAYERIIEKYPGPPTETPRTERIQHPIFHQLAVDALQSFSRLSKFDRDAVIENLEASLISMEQWLTHLRQSDYQVLCLGEFHEESTRRFLADEFFAKFSIDVLLLEATPTELMRISKLVNAGRAYFPLLDADITKILRTVRSRNPDIRIYGIEETDKQHKDRQGHEWSRDQSIARNFWNRFQPGTRHAILIGALHCTNRPDWLFEYLRDQAPPPLAERMLNVQVLGEHQDGPLEAFVFFLDEIGVERKHFVIPDTSALHPFTRELFQLLYQQVLGRFRALVVFRM